VLVGLLDGQFLVDQAFQDLLAGAFGLFGAQIALLLQHEVDLVDGDFFLVDTRSGLAGDLVLAAATAQQEHAGHGGCGGQRRPAARTAKGDGHREGDGHRDGHEWIPRNWSAWGRPRAVPAAARLKANPGPARRQAV